MAKAFLYNQTTGKTIGQFLVTNSASELYYSEFIPGKVNTEAHEK